LQEKNFFTLFVFSYEDFDSFLKFKSLIRNSVNMWLGWVGSNFLEQFDEYIKSILPNFSTQLTKYITETRKSKNKRKKGSSVHYEARSKEELSKLRRFYYEAFNELLYVKLGNYKISDEKSSFKISLSDRTEFTLKGGGLYEFLNLYKSIITYAQKKRDQFTRRILINRKQRYVKDLKKPIESFNVEKIEYIEIDMKNAVFESWYKNLVNTFSIGYLETPKLMSFVLEKGNPYFMAEIIDLEIESRIFLSAIEDSIRISPASHDTKPSTISKLFSIMQSQVDPSIDMSE
jgi:hypothetical protein